MEVEEESDLVSEANGGDLKKVLALIAEGADVNSRNENGVSALIYAASHGEVAMVDALIQAGADVNARDNDTETVLMWASSWGHTEAVKRLIAAGADVNARSNLNGTALSWAVRYAPVETVRVLLDAGADVNASGARALYGAIYRRHPEIVALLIERGADLTIYDEDVGGTPLALAKKCGNGEVVRLLKAAGATE